MWTTSLTTPVTYTTNTNTNILNNSILNNYVSTTGSTTLYSGIWNSWTEQRVGNEIINIPHNVTLAPTDVKWEAWIESDANERNKRQAAREAYNQALQETARKKALQEAERIAADARARCLLFEHLTEEQKLSWTEHKLFDKQINGNTYRFTWGTHGNVSKLQDGQTIEKFCIAPKAPHDGGMLPVEDVVLAQLLFLEIDEVNFRKIANISNYAPRATTAPPRGQPIVRLEPEQGPIAVPIAA